ncbi:MAG: M61 family metallopeptidase, partial [Gammaproteobacteria bacterium]|nr:M61 family metallopeptidase [Gammaproteobacteria bacterium]
MTPIQYHVSLANPHAHLFNIELRIPAPDHDGQTVSLPAWIPGSYMIRDFAKNIEQFAVSSSGGQLKWEKLDKQTWRCEPCVGPLIIRYQVYAWDLSVRAAHFDTTHAYFNGTSLFLRVHGQDATPLQVEIERPDTAIATGWTVATSMLVEDVDVDGFGLYQAEDYSDLIDHPVEIGLLTLLEFTLQGVTHRMAIYGRHQADTQRLEHDLSKVCGQHSTMFGELPLDRYLFLVMAVGDGYGGLEHKNSTSLLCNRDDLPNADSAANGEGYRRFLGLCSHEYFHLWNVKRIQPEVFRNQNMDREIHTRLLWVSEGITSYYDDLGLVRSACIEPKEYLALLANTITRVMRGKGRLKQSVAESSFDAWTRFYKQDENAPNAIVSYYTKGALVALALDLTLRIETEGECSLDDVMRALWMRNGRTGIGLKEGVVEALVAEISGQDMKEFFAHAVYGTTDLPLNSLLQYVGIEMHLRPSRDDEDMGGCVEKFGSTNARSVLGVRMQEGQDTVIGTIFEGGAAQAAGLSAGDQIMAVNGIKATALN